MGSTHRQLNSADGCGTHNQAEIFKIANSSDNNNPVDEAKNKVFYNRKRSNRVSSLKRKNFDLTKQIKPLFNNRDITPEQGIYLQKLSRNLNLCSSHSLYREHLSNNAVEYIGSHTCDHKLCFVCNSMRQKRIRRKYLNFFDTNHTLNILRNNKSNSERAFTKSVYDKMLSDGDVPSKHTFVKEVGYDLMHLTLTVPHYEGSGFRGYEYYYDDIIRLFNFLRKKKQWNYFVYGGEYGIETTKGKNGLNIHIHALLMVRQEKQNRNKLHKYILQQWNRMTFNPYNPRDGFSDEVNFKIRKSNKLLTYNDVSKLNPKGSTIITLENIYNLDDKGNKERVSGNDLVGSDFGSDAMMSAVMETISYHFEPQCFDKKEGEYDIELMLNIMPVLQGKPLYRKFGCLHREQSLNIKISTAERIQEDFSESGSQEVINPVSFIPAEREEYTFFVSNPACVYHIESEALKPVFSRSSKRTYLNDPPDTISALTEMTYMFVDSVFRDSAKKKSQERALFSPNWDNLE